MSVLIKGMEMPTSCMLCPFCVEEADPANGEMCMVTGTLMPPCTRERLDNCPLFPVQPHGRLIDADALMDALTRAKEDDPLQYEDDYFAVSGWLCVAPTVIESEPCNDLAKPNNTIFAVQNADEDEGLFAAKPIDYMHHPSVEEIIEADGLDSFIKHFED